MSELKFKKLYLPKDQILARLERDTTPEACQTGGSYSVLAEIKHAASEHARYARNVGVAVKPGLLTQLAEEKCTVCLWNFSKYRSETDSFDASLNGIQVCEVVYDQLPHIYVSYLISCASLPVCRSWFAARKFRNHLMHMLHGNTSNIKVSHLNINGIQTAGRLPLVITQSNAGVVDTDRNSCHGRLAESDRNAI